MERRTEPATPRPGDRIIFAKAGGVYAVIWITPSAHEETLRNYSTLDLAYDFVRSGLSGGRLWWRHYSAPTVTEPYRAPITELIHNP